MYLGALRMGYTRTDLATMGYGEIIFDFAAMNETPEGTNDEPAKAPVEMETQQDIRTMLG